MTVKGAEFLDLYNDLKEMVCLDNNLDLWQQHAHPNIHVIGIDTLNAKKVLDVITEPKKTTNLSKLHAP
jgi:hypothetical protein